MNNHRRHVHLISIEQGSGFDQLDRKLQSLVMSVARDQITFDELKGLVLVENLSTRQHVSQEFEKVPKLRGDSPVLSRQFEPSDIQWAYETYLHFKPASLFRPTP